MKCWVICRGEGELASSLWECGAGAFSTKGGRWRDEVGSDGVWSATRRHSAILHNRRASRTQVGRCLPHRIRRHFVAPPSPLRGEGFAPCFVSGQFTVSTLPGNV